MDCYTISRVDKDPNNMKKERGKNIDLQPAQAIWNGDAER